MHIGGKLRRLRQERRLTQAQMAAELGISPSYLNLIESNRRPVTARVLLQIADKLKIEIGQFADGDDQQLTSELMEALSDPVFEEHDVKVSDVRELVATLPSVGRALLALYRSHLLQDGSSAAVSNGAGDPQAENVLSVLPSEEVSEFIQSRLADRPRCHPVHRRACCREDRRPDGDAAPCHRPPP